MIIAEHSEPQLCDSSGEKPALEFSDESAALAGALMRGGDDNSLHPATMVVVTSHRAGHDPPIGICPDDEEAIVTGQPFDKLVVVCVVPMSESACGP